MQTPDSKQVFMFLSFVLITVINQELRGSLGTSVWVDGVGVCWGSETSDTLQDADSKKGM